MEKIFTTDFLKEIGFNLISEQASKYKPYALYGKAKDRIGLTIIYWNEEGAHCTYYGEVLKPNNYFCIEKDGGTRTVFNGYVFTQDDVRKLLSLTY